MAEFATEQFSTSLGQCKLSGEMQMIKKGLGAKTGDFGCFKYEANLKRYELKLFDGARVEFEEKGQVDVGDNEGKQHQVPCWQPVNVFKK